MLSTNYEVINMNTNIVESVKDLEELFENKVIDHYIGDPISFDEFMSTTDLSSYIGEDVETSIDELLDNYRSYCNE